MSLSNVDLPESDGPDEEELSVSRVMPLRTGTTLPPCSQTFQTSLGCVVRLDTHGLLRLISKSSPGGCKDASKPIVKPTKMGAGSEEGSNLICGRMALKRAAESSAR